MSIETHTMLLPGFDDMHVGLRHVECACGCGETFWCKNVGRPKLYLNASHKARYYRNQKKGTVHGFDHKASAQGFSLAVQECLNTIRQFEENESAKDYAAFYLDTVKGLLESALEQNMPY